MKCVINEGTLSLKAFDKVYHIPSARQKAIAVYAQIYLNLNTARKQ